MILTYLFNHPNNTIYLLPILIFMKKSAINIAQFNNSIVDVLNLHVEQYNKIKTNHINFPQKNGRNS